MWLFSNCIIHSIGQTDNYFETTFSLLPLSINTLVTLASKAPYKINRDYFMESARVQFLFTSREVS